MGRKAFLPMMHMADGIICGNYRDMRMGKMRVGKHSVCGRKVRCLSVGILLMAILAGMSGCGPAEDGQETGTGGQGDVAADEAESVSLEQEPDSDDAKKPQEKATEEQGWMDSPEDKEEWYNLTFVLADGEKALAGLPQEVAGQITGLNAGEALEVAVGLDDLEGYSALIGTHAITAIDKESGQEGTGMGRLTMYVPNLLESLQDVSVLFYDYADGSWKKLPAETMDADAKTVTVILTGSGIMTVIYRRP